MAASLKLASKLHHSPVRMPKCHLMECRMPENYMPSSMPDTRFCIYLSRKSQEASLSSFPTKNLKIDRGTAFPAWKFARFPARKTHGSFCTAFARGLSRPFSLAEMLSRLTEEGVGERGLDCTIARSSLLLRRINRIEERSSRRGIARIFQGPLHKPGIAIHPSRANTSISSSATMTTRRNARSHKTAHSTRNSPHPHDAHVRWHAAAWPSRLVAVELRERHWYVQMEYSRKYVDGMRWVSEEDMEMSFEAGWSVKARRGM